MTYFKSKNNIVGHKYSIQIYCTNYLLLPKWVFQPIHPYVIRRVVIYSSSHLLVGVAHGSVTAEHPTPIADYVRCTANFFVVISLWSTHGFTLNIKVMYIYIYIGRQVHSIHQSFDHSEQSTCRLLLEKTVLSQTIHLNLDLRYGCNNNSKLSLSEPLSFCFIMGTNFRWLTDKPKIEILFILAWITCCGITQCSRIKFNFRNHRNDSIRD